jgi:hypothetical protein
MIMFMKEWPFHKVILQEKEKKRKREKHGGPLFSLSNLIKVKKRCLI